MPLFLKLSTKVRRLLIFPRKMMARFFTLCYTEDFVGSGVLPFNFKPSERHKVEIGAVYKSPFFWYAFAARVPNLSRPDFQEELERASLTGNEPVLELIGKMSRRSISRSWIVEIDEAA